MNDLRITQYALGELQGAEREEFEKELAQSEVLQRELQETISMCERLQALPAPDDALRDEQRTALREACRANLKVAPRRIDKRRIIVYGALGALAACLLLMPLMPWAEVSRIANNPPEVKQETAPAFLITTSVEPAATPVTLGTNIVASTIEIPTTSPLLAAKSADTGAVSANAVGQNVTSHTTSQDLGEKLKSESDQLMTEGEAFYDAGRYDLAFKRYTQVLNNDPYNIAARRGQEKVNLSRQTYATTAYNETRSRMDIHADLSWERPVTRFESQASAAAPMASLAVSSGPVAVTMSSGLSTGPETRRFAKGEAFRGNVRPSEEAYESLDENSFLVAREHPLSTFSIDVDTASYANIRRFLQRDQLPPSDAVRIEELVNYFSYDYPQPKDGQPFSVNIEAAAAPWNPQHELVRIALKGREIPVNDRGPANLVFLIDVSGSMESENKLPLLKRSLQALVKNLSAEDRVAIVVYAGSSGLALPSTSGKDRARILEALNNLKAGGGTNGGEGIELAYRTARENFLKEGNNRVILCSDGDFNVGITNQSDLVALIEKERRSGVFLSVLGFGDGNLKDVTMEKLADKGNGNYAYIDSFAEGRKVLVEQMSSTLFTIAKDVKIQVEFNPAQVAGYRLIGYENRLLAKEDFNNDKKDAGEIGAGHAVTALYEIVRAGQPVPDQPSVDPLKYQAPLAKAKSDPAPASGPVSGDLLTLKLRYKTSDGDKSQLIEKATPAGEVRPFDQASSDFQFAAAVVAFGLKLRGSEHEGNISWSEIQKIARRNLSEDSGSYRAEFLTLVERASKLQGSGQE